MSVRIYELSKQLKMENKELIALLKERGFEVKSASSTIATIYAEDLVQEFGAAAEATDATESGTDETVDKAEADKITKPALPPRPDVSKLVKSADDVIREREEKKAATAASVTPPAPPRPAPPAAGNRPPPPPPVGSRPPMPPPLRKPGAAPKPAPAVARPPQASPTIPSGVVRSASEAAEAKQKASAPPPSAKPAAVSPPVTKSAPAVPAAESAARPAAPPRIVPKSSGPVAPPVVGRPAPATPSAKAPEDAGQDTVEGGRTLIKIKPPIVVRDFAAQINLKPFQLISELMEFGIFGSMNQTIEEDVAMRIAAKHGFELEIRHRGESAGAKDEAKLTPEDEEKLLRPRPPVVCVMGHVDHGKTTLLDAIRKTNVVEGEAGGITQHVGAYQVMVGDHPITFIDTPGHAAFTKMRERGAEVTDIAILVVAADDGFMPQTDEALKFAQKASVPVVVAINKMDAKGANLDRVKQMMQQRGIAPEDWGGETLCQPVSALKGEGIEVLLEQVILQAEMLELKANPSCAAEGIIVEAQLEQGRGCTATVIVRKGTLKKGDALVSGTAYCKVRSLVDDFGKPLKSISPGMPAKVVGWSETPRSGAIFTAVKNEREAKGIAEENLIAKRAESAVPEEAAPEANLESLFAAIASSKQTTLRVIVKGDVHGTVEALVSALEDIRSDKVNLEVIQSGVGPVSKNDILLASTSGATVIGFNVKVESGVLPVAKHHGIQIIQHQIIYQLIDQIKDVMADLLEPELHENKTGAAEVRQIFTVSRGGKIAGCMVTQGQIVRDGLARVSRGGEVVHEGKVAQLKRFKDDVAEVRAGFECGINIEGFHAMEEGDVIECFEVKRIKPSLF